MENKTENGNKTLNGHKNANVNKQHKDSMTVLEKFAVSITEKVGSMGFFIIIFIWTFGWLIWNIFAPEDLKFDPYPAFVVWLFLSNMIQIFLMPLIMIGQNLQARHAELRAERHYKADIKADNNVLEIKKKMEEQTVLIQSLMKKLEEK
jgi:uncharacterized membrane protein